MKYEKEARLISEISSKSTLLIWERAGHKNYFDYMRSRIRILRATVLNIVPIIISLEWTVFGNIKNNITRSHLAIFILIIGVSGIIIGHRSLLILLSSFYNKGRILEIEIEKQEIETVS